MRTRADEGYNEMVVDPDIATTDEDIEAIYFDVIDTDNDDGVTHTHTHTQNKCSIILFSLGVCVWVSVRERGERGATGFAIKKLKSSNSSSVV